MAKAGTRLGEFEQAINGLFDFEPRDMLSRSSYFGLQLNDTWLMAHLREPATGRLLHIVRPLALETSAGMSFSVQREDGIYSDPRGADFLRGGYLKRHLDDGGDLAFDGSGGAWSGGSTQSYRARFGARMAWQDSGYLDLRGRILGPGTQLYIPWRDGEAAGGTCHTGLFYEVEGELFGQAVSGIAIFDQAFSPPGQTLHDSIVRRRYIGAWNAFASVYEDGSVQYGQFGYGGGPFKYANVVDGDRHICCAIEEVRAEYDSAGLGTRLEYRLANGEVWECVVDPRGTLQDITRAAMAQGANLQVHKGHVGRLGEARRRRNGYAVVEWFPGKIAHPDTADAVLPAGL